MKLAVRTAKLNTVKAQLLSLLELGEEDMLTIETNYSGITLLNLNENAVTSFGSVRNIEAILLDEVATAELLQPNTAMTSEALSLKSMDFVDELDQFEYLSRLLHIYKVTKGNR